MTNHPHHSTNIRKQHNFYCEKRMWHMRLQLWGISFWNFPLILRNLLISILFLYCSHFTVGSTLTSRHVLWWWQKMILKMKKHDAKSSLWIFNEWTIYCWEGRERWMNMQKKMNLFTALWLVVVNRSSHQPSQVCTAPFAGNLQPL